MIKVGLVGVGGFAATWRRVLDQLEREGIACVHAVAERNQAGQVETLAQLAERGCHVTSSLTELLAQHGDAIDLIGLPVGIPWHHALVREALQAGKHVLVEKPFCATIQQAHELDALAAENDLQLEVAYQFMYSPVVRELGRRIQNGDLGRVISLASYACWPRTTSYYARNGWAGRIRLDDLPVLDGPATNATAHYLMNLLYLGGCTPGQATLAAIENVQAELYHAKPIESYDTSSIRATLANGAVLVHNVSHAVAETTSPVMDIRLERATVHWVASSDAATITYDDGHIETLASPAPDKTHDLPLRHMVATIGGQRSVKGKHLHCTAEMATRQVLVINLAFESSGPVHTIPTSFCSVTTRDAARDTQDVLVAVDGMADLLRRAQDEHSLISELGNIPWAVPTSPVRADGLDTFAIDDWAHTNA